MDFAQWVEAYEALIAKVRDGKIGIDDLTGATISITNPGTIGTVQSVPRLMPGQGAIIGVGRIGYPAEFEAADPKMVAQLGLSKIITITSTYDHRIIQGAESGPVPQAGPRAPARRGRLLRSSSSPTCRSPTRRSGGGSTTGRPTTRTRSTGP